MGRNVEDGLRVQQPYLYAKERATFLHLVKLCSPEAHWKSSLSAVKLFFQCSRRQILESAEGTDRINFWNTDRIPEDTSFCGYPLVVWVFSSANYDTKDISRIVSTIINRRYRHSNIVTLFASWQIYAISFHHPSHCQPSISLAYLQYHSLRAQLTPDSGDGEAYHASVLGQTSLNSVMTGGVNSNPLSL
ncbi:hypothetical protein PoB_002823800 [Plakobranchus ocellatus]|uniref:Uncharacterized protein n=1 Tax=Plakobranchus ocellatus TaxID=259542 RepID=A0AAV4A3H1_9GAST|nr:hypothetical protein PoB_002823800 [Plakobranchus ocellatus]